MVLLLQEGYRDSSKTNTEVSMSNLSDFWVCIHLKEMKMGPQVLLSDTKQSYHLSDRYRVIRFIQKEKKMNGHC